MDIKKILLSILFPPSYVPLITTPTSIICLIIVFTNGMDTHPASILAYLISFYSLCVLVAYCVKTGPSKYRMIKSKIYNSKYGYRYITDIDFKTHVTLYFSLAINAANVPLNIIYGLVYNTNWFFVLAFYYATLTAMRCSLALFTKKNALGKNKLGEWRRARVCASVLTLINLSLSGVVLMMMYQNKGFTYAGILIYIMAAYTFYHLTSAIIDIFRYRKYNSPIVDSVKSVKLAAALISLLSLETAMLTAFGANMPIEEKRIFIAATGVGICFVVVGISSYMIVRSTKEINKIKENIQ